MESDFETDCSCIPPPPSFDLAPPPKPDSLQWVSDVDEGPTESCPLYLLDATAVTNFVHNFESVARISGPLFNLVIMSVSLVLLLILGSCTVIWCRKKKRCSVKKNSTKSHLPVTEKLLSGANSTDHNRNGFTKNFNGISNGFDSTITLKRTNPDQIYQPVNGSDNKRISIYDTLNPVYEEISLENLASSDVVNKTKKRPPHFVGSRNNNSETSNLLPDNIANGDNDKHGCVRQCNNCKRRLSRVNIADGDNDFIEKNGDTCRCSFISLPNDDLQIYRNKFSDRNLSDGYRQTAYV